MRCLAKSSTNGYKRNVKKNYETELVEVCFYTINLLDLNVRDTGDTTKNPDLYGWGFLFWG